VESTYTEIIEEVDGKWVRPEFEVCALTRDGERLGMK
jgi:hypothetical protein